MARWAALLIAFAACTQEKPLGRELHLPPPEPTPIRVELGECARSSDEFVSGEAPPEPDYWTVIDSEWRSHEFGGGYGTWGTIGHGSGIGGTGSGWGSIRGRYSPAPVATLSAIEVTGADPETWKPITRRYVKRNLQKISDCYEKELLNNGQLAGKFVATLHVTKAGKVGATVTQSFDTRVSSCIKGVLDAIEIPKPESAYTATVPILFSPSPEVREAQRTADAEATAVGAQHPLAGREAEIAACLRTTPTPAGAGVIDWQFGVDGKATTVTLVGAENECIKKLATTAKNTSRAKNLRCAFLTGDAAPGELVTVGVLPDGMVRFEGNPLEVYKLGSKIGDAVTYGSSSWARTVTRGPIALAPGATVPMKDVKSVIQEVRRLNIDTVFVVPHAFGGIRLLGARVPLRMAPKGSTRTDALHVVHVHRDGVDVDDVSVTSAAELMGVLQRIRREDGPAVQVRFDMDATFADFAQVIDMAVEAGLTDWHL